MHDLCGSHEVQDFTCEARNEPCKSSCDKVTISSRLGVYHSLLGRLLLPPLSEEKKNKSRQEKCAEDGFSSTGLTFPPEERQLPEILCLTRGDGSEDRG